MERMIDAQLDEIRKLLSVMGGRVEQALENAVSGLQDRNPALFQKVHDLEEAVNLDHLEVDNACLNFLAKQGPVAKDLRLLFSFIKINADLERMGDQCVNVAHTGKDFLGHPVAMIPIEIPEMASHVRQMVKWSLDAVMAEDVELARKVLLADDEVDWRKKKIFDDMVAAIEKSKVPVATAMDFILIARNLERLGDHATNIAEDVIFVSTGKDIRHGGKFAGKDA